MKRSFSLFIFLSFVFLNGFSFGTDGILLPGKGGFYSGHELKKGFSAGYEVNKTVLRLDNFNKRILPYNRNLFTSDSKFNLSGMGGGIFEGSLIEGNFALFLGGGCAFTVNNFFVGAYGLALSTGHVFTDFVECPGDRVRMSFTHGGLWLGWAYKIKPAIGFGLSAKIGGGAVSYNNLDKSYFTKLDYTRCSVLVITPQFEADIRLFPAVKLNIGIGYRALAGLDPDVYNSSEFFSPVLSIAFFFGSFSDSSDVPDVDE